MYYLQVTLSDFFQNQLFRKILSAIPSVSNRLDPYEARRLAGPDLGSNCLQWLSADKKKTVNLGSQMQE